MRVTTEQLKSLLLTLAALATVVLFAACGSDDDGDGDDGNNPDPQPQGERADTLHGGSSKSWQLLSGVVKSSVGGQALPEQNLPIQDCLLDDALVFTASGNDLIQIEGDVPCGSAAQGDTLRTTGYVFVEGAEEKLVVNDGLLEGFDLVSDTLNIAELTPTRLTLYEEIESGIGGITTVSRTEVTLSSE